MALVARRGPAMDDGSPIGAPERGAVGGSTEEETMNNDDIDRFPWKRRDLLSQAREAARGGRCYWAFGDPTLEIEAIGMQTQRGEDRVYFGEAPELRALYLLPPLCPDGADVKTILRSARAAVFAALDPRERAQLAKTSRGRITNASDDFVARARPLPPDRRADLLALLDVSSGPISQAEGAPTGMLGFFTCAAIHLEAVVTRNVAGTPRVLFTIAPPLRSLGLPVETANSTPDALNEGALIVRALVTIERLTNMRRAA